MAAKSQEEKEARIEADESQQEIKQTSGARVDLYYLTKNGEVEKTTNNVHKAYRWAEQGFNFSFEEYNLTKEDYLNCNFTPPMEK